MADLKITVDVSQAYAAFQRLREESQKTERVLERLGGPAFGQISTSLGVLGRTIDQAGFKAGDAFNAQTLNAYRQKLAEVKQEAERVAAVIAKLREQRGLPFTQRDTGFLRGVTGIENASTARSAASIDTAVAGHEQRARSLGRDISVIQGQINTLDQFLSRLPGLKFATEQYLRFGEVLAQARDPLSALSRALEASGVGGRFRQGIEADNKAMSAQIEKINSLVIWLERLEKMRQDLTGRTSLFRNEEVDQGGQQVPLDTAVRSQLGLGQGPLATEDFVGKIDQAMARANDELTEASTTMGQFSGEITGAVDALGLMKERFSAIKGALDPERDTLEQLLSGEAINKTIQDRAQKLGQAQSVLTEQLTRLKERAIDAVGGRAGDRNRGLISKAFEEEASAAKKVERNRTAVEDVERRLVALGDKRVASSIREAQIAAGQIDTTRAAAGLASASSAVQGLADSQVVSPGASELLRQYAQLLTEQIRLRTELTSATERTGEALRRETGNLKATGLLDPVRALEGDLAKVTAQLQKLRIVSATGGSDEVLRLLGGDSSARVFRALIVASERLTEVRRKLAQSTGLAADEERRLHREAGKLQAQVGKFGGRVAEDLQAFAGEAVAPAILSPDQLSQELLKGLPAIERTMINAFSDIGRRFVATLQFAISGTLIFAAQQLVRDLFDAAVSVERTFADITTALKFDPDFKLLDDSQLDIAAEKIRRDVLLIANDLNALPTEANKAAFVMVARFQDSGNALKALRAQLLATKVSGIDQTEVLRALTASAEGWATSIALSNDKLTLQKRLLTRESIAADLYGKILDQAVLIQQRWGVEVEDTIEGTGRAVEVFREIGFTVTETEAIIAASSLRLGQTGTNVAERLNRAFGALADPAIVDKIVEFSNVSDNLAISFKDLENPASLLKSIQSQVHNLDAGELERLIQIIGQRRETDVVAAFFGSADIQTDILNNAGQAADAAQERFEVLSRTTSELIQSIIVKFDELAQNLERVGALSPVKVFLQISEAVLSVVNGLLKSTRSLYDALNSIGGIKFGSILRTTAILLTTFLAIERSIRAIQTVRQFSGLVSTALVAAGGGVAGGAGVGGAVAAGGIAAAVSARAIKGLDAMVLGLNTATVSVGNYARRLGPLGQQTFQVGEFMVASGAAQAANTAEVTRNTLARRLENANATGPIVGFIRRFPNFLKLAGGVIAVVAAMAIYAKALRDAAETMRQFELEESKRANARASRFAQEGTSIADQKIVTASEELSALSIALEGAQNRVISFLSQQSGGPDFDTPATGKAPGSGRFSPSGFFEVEPAEAIPNSRAFFLAEIERYQRSLLEGFNEALDTPTLDGSTARRSGARRKLADPLAVAFAEGVSELEAAISEERSPEEVEAIGSVVSELYARYLTAAGDVVSGTVTALSVFQKRIDTASREVQLGRSSPQDQEATLRQILGELQVQFAGTSSREARDLIEEKMDELEVQIFEVQLAGFRSRIDAINAGGEGRFTLERELGVLRQELEALKGSKAIKGDDMLRVLQAINAAQAALAAIFKAQGVDYAKFLLDNARTVEQAVTAGENYVNVLRRVASEVKEDALGRLFAERIPEAQAAITEALAQAQRVTDLSARQKALSARSGQPILNAVAQINAQLASIAVQIAASPSGVERGELILQQRELLAQRAQEVLRQQQAFVQAQAGVNDSLTLLRGNTVLAIRELTLAGQLWGKQSAEYLQLGLAVEQAQFALAGALIELDVLNRRLGSDLTNQFEQATIDLAEVMLNLANPDLGELERAKLTLQKNQAQNSLQKSFFDNALFELNFLSETGKLTSGAYVQSLRNLLSQVDITTTQGKEIFLQIQGVIDGLTNDLSNVAFNIPTAIRLPTLFEIRRALTADQLGVNYQDNRLQSITIHANTAVDVANLVGLISNQLGDSVTLASSRLATGGASFTIGGF